MFKVGETKPEEITAIRSKPRRGIVKRALTGSGTNPFGFYDFIIVLSIMPLWIFFTGLLLLFKRRLSKEWWGIINNGSHRQVAKKIRKKKTPAKVRITNITPRDTTNILAN